MVGKKRNINLKKSSKCRDSDMKYSEYRLEREGVRSQDNYVLSYRPENSDIGVQERIAPWIAQFIKEALLEKCPENVVEHTYGYRREGYATRESI